MDKDRHTHIREQIAQDYPRSLGGISFEPRRFDEEMGSPSENY